MKTANQEGMLERKLRDLMKYKVLIIDEIGYLPFNEEGAHCLFQLISRRYEKSSMILTSNKNLSKNPVALNVPSMYSFDLTGHPPQIDG